MYSGYFGQKMLMDPYGEWVIYDKLKSNPNYRLELSISALTRKFNLARIPILHDTLKSYGIVIEAKQAEKDGQKCVEVSIAGFGNVGALKNAAKSALKKIPLVKKYADKIEADVLVSGGIKLLDCECFKDKSDLELGGEVKIQFTAGYGLFFGKRSGGTDWRSGQGGSTGRDSTAGIRGPFAFAGKMVPWQDGAR